MKTTLLSATLVASLLAAGAQLSAQTFELEFIQSEEIFLNGAGLGVDYFGTHDAELRQETPNANEDLGTGSSNPEFTLDGDDPNGSGYDTNVVIRFDDIFNFVPAGATIVSASLFIDIDNNGDDMELYQLNGGFNWDETTTTWNNFGSSANDGVLVGTETVGSPIIVDGDGNKVFIDVTATVQAWFAGATNNGWAFLPTGSDGVDFDASENSDLFDRPALYIEYIPEPSALALLGLGGLALALVRRRR